jgi:hypothetical protein
MQALLTACLTSKDQNQLYVFLATGANHRGGSLLYHQWWAAASPPQATKSSALCTASAVSGARERLTSSCLSCSGSLAPSSAQMRSVSCRMPASQQDGKTGWADRRTSLVDSLSGRTCAVRNAR